MCRTSYPDTKHLPNAPHGSFVKRCYTESCVDHRRAKQNLHLWLAVITILCLLSTIVTYFYIPDGHSLEKSSIELALTTIKHGQMKKGMQRKSDDTSRHTAKQNGWREMLQDTRLVEYCRWNQHLIAGNEGKYSASPEYNLHQVYIVISPGLQAPSNNVPGLPRAWFSCILPTLSDPDLHAFVRVATDFVMLTKHVKDGFKEYDLFPMSPFCHSDDLTPKGVKQQIRLGRYLLSAYNGMMDGVIVSPNERNKRLRVAFKSITQDASFQSIVAFAYGFLGNQGLDSLHVQKSLDNFCNSSVIGELCRCVRAEGLQPFIHNAMHCGKFLFKSDQHKSSRSLAERIQQPAAELASAVQISHHVFAHVCESVSYTCGLNTECLGQDAVTAMFSEADSHWVHLSVDLLMQSYSALIAYPFLKNIIAQIENPSSESMHVFSADKHLITHVLISLGYLIDRMPHPAQRLVFEVYKKSTRKDLVMDPYHIRVIFDGRDITNLIIPCLRSSEMYQSICKFNYFKDFVNDDILISLNAKQYSQACSV